MVRIFRGAFDPASVVGGVGGLGLRQCMEWGLKRGVFSNEAGLGSSPIAHAASQETNPVHQGFYGIFEVFADSVICTMTGLSLLASGINLHYGVKGSLELNARAFATVFGPNLSALALALCCTLFALSTLLSWSLYGTRCWEFLLGSRFNRLYQTLFVALVPLGAVLDWGLVWGIADTLNGLMALPNCVALLGLAPVAAAMTKAHFSGPGSPDS